MVAFYKRKRLIGMMDKDESRTLHLEGSERQRGKRVVEEGLDDTIDLSELRLNAEIQYEADLRLDYECYAKSKADPNYICTCFDEEEEK